MSYPLKILLVEDEVVVGMLMRIELTRLGNEVVKHLTSGEDAISFAQTNKLDLILMDIQLTGKTNGIDAAIAIRSESPVPIIFMTGYADSAIRERAETLEPLGYLLKPITGAQIQAIIEARF